MDKNKKGLADQGEGEFILNESGTSVSTDHTDNEKTAGDEGDKATEDERITSPEKKSDR